jgi:phosphoglycolate phosphatase-like HAD superfamily hydrolase
VLIVGDFEDDAQVSHEAPVRLVALLGGGVRVELLEGHLHEVMVSRLLDRCQTAAPA